MREEEKKRIKKGIKRGRKEPKKDETGKGKGETKKSEGPWVFLLPSGITFRLFLLRVWVRAVVRDTHGLIAGSHDEVVGGDGREMKEKSTVLKQC